MIEHLLSIFPTVLYLAVVADWFHPTIFSEKWHSDLESAAPVCIPAFPPAMEELLFILLLCILSCRSLCLHIHNFKQKLTLKIIYMVAKIFLKGRHFLQAIVTIWLLQYNCFYLLFFHLNGALCFLLIFINIFSIYFSPLSDQFT